MVWKNKKREKKFRNGGCTVLRQERATTRSQGINISSQSWIIFEKDLRMSLDHKVNRSWTRSRYCAESERHAAMHRELCRHTGSSSFHHWSCDTGHCIPIELKRESQFRQREPSETGKHRPESLGLFLPTFRTLHCSTSGFLPSPPGTPIPALAPSQDKMQPIK